MIDVMRLREVLRYEPRSGIFRWSTRPNFRMKIGDIAGSLDHEGYSIIRVDGKNYRAHRLAWLYVHGRWPAREIDHKNCIRSDNRINNLREATRAQNAQNRGLSKSNILGVKGVCRSGKKFQARIKLNGRLTSLGSFDTIEQAQSVFTVAAKKRHGQFVNMGI